MLSVLVVGGTTEVRAQPVDDAPIISYVQFEGNDSFRDGQLRLRVRTSANRRFLGIPGFTWWRWVYQLGEAGTLGERISEALKASGEAPAYIDHSVLQADVERLEAFYEQEGFRQARVRSRLDTLSADRVGVTFHIEPGTPTYIRRITFQGLDALTLDQQMRLGRGSLLRTESVDPGQPLRLRARQQRYSEPVLHEERRRLLTFLRDRGYARVARDSIRAFITPRPSGPQADSFDVTFQVDVGRRFRFGDVHYEVTGPEETAARRDTVAVEGPGQLVPGGLLTVRVEDESRLDVDVLRRTLQFRPGEWYDQTALQATKRRLEATGLFAFSDIMPLPGDTVRPMPTLAPYLPHRIELRTRPRHRLRFETFMLQRSGVLGATDSELGTGVGGTYENANLFGGGEAFQLRVSGSVAIDADTRLFTSTQAEVTGSLSYPYLVAPFGRLDRAFNLYDARTRLSLSLMTARRDALRLIIRGRGNARFRLEMQHTPTILSMVDVLDVSLSNPDTLNGFSSRFLDRVLGSLDDPVQQAQIKEDYTQPQINNALRYTFRSARVDPLRRRQGYSFEASAEVGGNLPYLLDRLIITPDTLEGNVPGLSPFRASESQSRLVYRQYARMAGDLRRYHPMSDRAVLAWRAAVGVAHPIGKAAVVPFDRRFYSGGASSVRGWRLRQLGPGGARFVGDTAQDDRDVTNLLGGDIKLEASVEWRQTFLRNVLGADWMTVLFTDAGNVWFGPRNPGFGQGRDEEDGTPSEPLIGQDGRFELRDFYRELGVGSGVGLRIAWDYLIARLDIAVRAHDPAQPDGTLFPDGVEDPVLHFGIGHTF